MKNKNIAEILKNKIVIEILIGDKGFISDGRNDYWDKNQIRFGFPYLKGSEICQIGQLFGYGMEYINYHNTSRADMLRDLIDFCNETDKLQNFINYLFSKKNIMKDFSIDTSRNPDEFYSESCNIALSSINSVLYVNDVKIEKTRNNKYIINHIPNDENIETPLKEQIFKSEAKSKSRQMGDNTFNVFFSWTEDNRNKNNLITIFKTVIFKLNTEHYKGLEYRLTGTGEPTAGSPNIHYRIISDITTANCAFFDTTLFYTNNKNKAASNSNVMFELGYAEAILGERRCVMLKDRSTELEDAKAPFDISANQWVFIESDNFTSTENILLNQLKLIIDNNTDNRNNL